MSGEYTRGRETSSELTEVRTVLSRAEDAARTLERYRAQGNHGYVWPERTVEIPLDPDIEEMIHALQVVSATLDRWRRTGRTVKR